MKKLFFFLLTVITNNTVIAQNVGIGTTTPASKLHVVGNLLQENGTVTLNNPASIIQLQNLGVNKTYLQLSGDNLRLGTNGGNQLGKTIIRMAGADRILIDSTGNMQVLGLQDASLTSDGYITLGSVTGRNMVLDNNEIMVRNNGANDNLVLQNDGGNVGIGTGSPTANLHVNGNFKITDGTEGSRKVLTSDASGNAAWENTAFNNNDRIMIRYAGFGAPVFSDSLINSAVILYDNGGINFSQVTKRFTVTKSGLYHFEGAMTARFTVGSDELNDKQGLAPAVHLSINNGIPITLNSYYVKYPAGLFSLLETVKTTVPFKTDIYLDAGDFVVFKLTNPSFISGDEDYNSTSPGYISAYLISE